jgi:hypothetical protein
MHDLQKMLQGVFQGIAAFMYVVSAACWCHYLGCCGRCCFGAQH